MRAELNAAEKDRKRLSDSLTKMSAAQKSIASRQTAATGKVDAAADLQKQDAQRILDEASEQKIRIEEIAKLVVQGRYTTRQSLITSLPALFSAAAGALVLMLLSRYRAVTERIKVQQEVTAKAIAESSASTGVKLEEIHVLVDGNLSKARIEVLDLKDEVSRLKQEISRLLPDDMRLTLEARMAINAASSAKATTPVVAPVAPLKRE